MNDRKRFLFGMVLGVLIYAFILLLVPTRISAGGTDWGGVIHQDLVEIHRDLRSIANSLDEISGNLLQRPRAP